MGRRLPAERLPHAGSEITVRLFADADAVRVDVHDAGELPPVLEERNGPRFVQRARITPCAGRTTRQS
jgi:hypothetical protein